MNSFILNQTQSQNGQYFYQEFCRQLLSKIDLNEETILIQELTHPRFGNRIIVSLDTTPVYHTKINRRSNSIMKKVSDGVEKVIEMQLMTKLRKELLKSKGGRNEI